MKEKKVAILQSNYIPWKGYFDLIASVDEFIILDNVQYTKNDWRNRNKIKTRNGLQWLTIPVQTSGNFGQLINEVKVGHPSWTRKHWNSILLSYSKAPYFKLYAEELEHIYNEIGAETYLSNINRQFIDFICKKLNIKTSITCSTDYAVNSSDKEDRVIQLCKVAKGTTYISGPAAKTYINPSNFTANGITLEFADYSNYKPYNQLYPPFEHAVSIFDLMFQLGDSAFAYVHSE